MSRNAGWENNERVPVSEPDIYEEPPRPERSALVMARRLVGLMLADTSPALGVECLAVVTSIGYEGDSLAEIGRRHGVTRAAVSKRCVDLCEALGIPPTRAMRTEENRCRCRKARLQHLAST